jgi:glycosyltransferase involved in cell wall biosynthesis
MAAGTAIVASDIHGYKGVLQRGVQGLLVPPGKPKEIAAALARLLGDDELREAMGRAGRERAQEFSWERVTAKVEDYYGFVIRRLAAQGRLPSGFNAEIPQSPRLAAAGAEALLEEVPA